MQNPGIVTLWEGDSIDSILRFFFSQTSRTIWSKGFFRCSGCYFNDRYSKQSAALTCWNVMWDMLLSSGDSPFGMTISSPDTKENDSPLNRFAVRAFNTAHMEEEQIWTPKLFTADQPALKHWFFLVGAVLKDGIVMYSKPIPASFRSVWFYFCLKQGVQHNHQPSLIARKW